MISYCKWCCQINLKNDLKHFCFYQAVESKANILFGIIYLYFTNETQ